MADIEYHALEPEDDSLFESAENIYANSWGRTDFMPGENQISEWVNDTNQDVFMAFEDGEPVGVAVISYGEVGEFCYNAVKPEHQSKGIGTKLVKARKKAAKSYGCKKLISSVTANHSGAQKIYEREGFSPAGIRVETGKEGFQEQNEDTGVYMVDYLESGGPKNINISKGWREFVENRLSEFSQISSRSYEGLDSRDKKAVKNNSGDDFVIDFMQESVFNPGESLEEILNEIESYPSDSRSVNVDLSDRKSAEVIRSLEKSGFQPCGFLPHWLGRDKKDYLVLQDTPNYSTEAVLTNSSLEVAEELDLVQEKEKRDGDWITLLG